MFVHMLMLIALHSGQVETPQNRPQEDTRLTQDAAETRSKKNEDKMVCRTTVETGTRFPNRVCKRRSEWDAETREAKQSMRGANRQSGTCDTRC